MRIHEEVTVTRDVEAVVVPAGDVILIPEGVSVTITQALGGSFTVLTPHGYLARVAGTDADALGKELPAGSDDTAGMRKGPPPDASAIEKEVWEQLRLVYDPEIPVNIVDLGLVYGCEVTPGEGGADVAIRMTMTAPGCGMGDVLAREAEDRVGSVAGVVSVRAEIVWDPPWDQSRMSEAARLELGFG
jgi:probable FeS assembly SUF system protein SufT